MSTSKGERCEDYFWGREWGLKQKAQSRGETDSRDCSSKYKTLKIELVTYPDTSVRICTTWALVDGKIPPVPLTG